MVDLPDLGRDLGPFSIAEWGVIAVGGIGLGLIARRFIGPSSTGGGSTLSMTDKPLTAAGSAITLPDGAAIVGADRSATIDTATVIETNEAWRVEAVRHLTSSGIDALASSEAVRAHLAGDRQLTATERAWISSAIGALGPTPQSTPTPAVSDGHTTAPPPVTKPSPTAPPAPAPTPAPKPAPKPAPTPKPTPAPKPAPTPAPQRRTHVVVRGDTLSNIARRYYNGNANRWRDIYNANRTVIGANPNLIFPGQTLLIPT